jgi:hypothetical protein
MSPTALIALSITQASQRHRYHPQAISTVAAIQGKNICALPSRRIKRASTGTSLAGRSGKPVSVCKHPLELPGITALHLVRYLNCEQGCQFQFSTLLFTFRLNVIASARSWSVTMSARSLLVLVSAIGLVYTSCRRPATPRDVPVIGHRRGRRGASHGHRQVPGSSA